MQRRRSHLEDMKLEAAREDETEGWREAAPEGKSTTTYFTICLFVLRVVFISSGICRFIFSLCFSGFYIIKG